MQNRRTANGNVIEHRPANVNEPLWVGDSFSETGNFRCKRKEPVVSSAQLGHGNVMEIGQAWRAGLTSSTEGAVQRGDPIIYAGDLKSHEPPLIQLPREVRCRGLEVFVGGPTCYDRDAAGKWHQPHGVTSILH